MKNSAGETIWIEQDIQPGDAASFGSKMLHGAAVVDLGARADRLSFQGCRMSIFTVCNLAINARVSEPVEPGRG